MGSGDGAGGAVFSEAVGGGVGGLEGLGWGGGGEEGEGDVMYNDRLIFNFWSTLGA